MAEKLMPVESSREYKDSLILLNKIFYIHEQLPNQVFMSAYSGFMFQDFDWTMTRYFWNFVLKPLGNMFEDDYILTTVLDPDPVNYFYHNFGYYNMFKFPLNTAGSDYWKSLESGPVGSPADAILYNSDIVVWAPASAKWAIWGQRSYEICILAFSDKESHKLASSQLQLNWKQAGNSLSNSVLKNLSPASYNLFLQNYK